MGACIPILQSGRAAHGIAAPGSREANVKHLVSLIWRKSHKDAHSPATTRSQALQTCYTGSTWGLDQIVSSTFAILLFPSLDLQLFRPRPKSTQTINQNSQGVTRWIHIAHKGLIRDCCQSQQSFSIPTLILNAITPSISHILQSQPSGCLHVSTACRWPAKPRHTAHRRTTIASQICPQHTQTNMFRTSTSLRALCTVEWNVCVVSSA